MSAGATDIRFAVADASHDAGILALLREAPMHGDIAISLQREPSYFAAARMEGGEHAAIVALDRDDAVVCAGAISVRERYFDGKAQRVGYLGQLRLAPSHAGRFDILRCGYAYFRALLPTLNVTACFTSIASDNVRAARFLERGLPGLPQYEAIGGLVTAAMPVPLRATESRFPSDDVELYPATGCDLDRVVELLNERAAEQQLSPVWSRQELDRLADSGGLSPQNICMLSDCGKVTGCAALWDQRARKQTVIMGYSRRLALLRPIYNTWATLTRRARLPAAGEHLSQAFVSPLALPINKPQLLARALHFLFFRARELGIKIVTLALDARDRRLNLLQRKFRAHLYRTRIYTVSWPDAPPRTQALDARLLGPEVALL